MNSSSRSAYTIGGSTTSSAVDSFSQNGDERADTPDDNERKQPEVAGHSAGRLFMIAAGSFVLYFASWGLAQGFGVLFIALKNEYGSSNAETTWVPSLYGGVLLATGPLSGVFIKLYGCRKMGVVGTLLLTGGLVSSYFTPSLHVLYVTYGVIGGIGGSLLLTTAGVVVLENFVKWRSLVIGISESGNSLGAVLIPLLTDACLEQYGFRGTFLLLGGLALQCLVASLVFPAHRPAENTSRIEKHSAKETVTRRSKMTVLKSMFAFFNAGYAAYAASWALFMLPFLVPFIFLPDAAMATGLTQRQAAYIGSALGVGSVIGKLVFGFLGDVKCLETTLLHIVPIILFGTLSLIYNVISGFTNFMVLAALFGLVSSICDGIHPVITLQLLDPDHLSVGLGMLYFLMSITTVLGSPIAGWIADSFGGYKEAFYYCAGCSFLAALIAIYIPFWKRRHIVNKKKKQDNVEVYTLSEKLPSLSLAI